VRTLATNVVNSVAAIPSLIHSHFLLIAPPLDEKGVTTSASRALGGRKEAHE